MSEIKIINCWICPPENKSVQPVFGDIIIKDGKISEIRQRRFKLINEKSSSYKLINAGGRVLTLPLINFHDHIYSRLAKGLNITGGTENFLQILKNLWWKLDLLIDDGIISASAKMGALESIKKGVTYIYDHHSSPASVTNSLNIIKKEFDTFGLRGALCHETSDRNSVLLRNYSLEENERFIVENIDGNFRGVYGLHASFTLEYDTLFKVNQFVEKNRAGIHIHLCEDMIDKSKSLTMFNKTPLDRLNDAMLLNELSILSHAIHLDKMEYDLIAEKKCGIAFNIESNLNNSVGITNLAAINRDIPFLMGTDGMNANIAGSMKNLFLQLRNHNLSFEESFKVFIKMYFDQYEFAGRYFSDLSLLKAGDRADMIIWDYVPPTPLTAQNFFGHFIYGILDREIMTVIQNGSLLKDEFKLSIDDEEAIWNEISTEGKRLTELFN